MKRTLLKELGSVKGQDVLLKGWVHRIKKMKNFSFVILRDLSSYCQLIVDSNIKADLRCEDVIEVKGILRESKNMYGDIEVEVTALNILNKAENLPITVNDDAPITLDTMLSNRVLSLRREKYHNIFLLQNLIVDVFRDYLKTQSFTEIRTPKLTMGSAEGGSSLFTLDYFGKKAALAQSPQFYKQMLVASGYERVFEIAPVFRAEEFSTKRHLNEYTSMDLEMGFIENEFELMDLEEGFIERLLKEISNRKDLIETLNLDVPEFKTIPRISFRNALEILDSMNHHVEKDLDPKSEILLCQYSVEKFNSPFIFIYDYPREKRPMYTMPKDEIYTRSFDLLFRGMEITTGGQRIHSKEMLIESFKLKGLNPENFKSYIDNFSYGFPPHGGLAIGLERITSLLCGYDNLRYGTLFPRDKERIEP